MEIPLKIKLRGLQPKMEGLPLPMVLNKLHQAKSSKLLVVCTTTQTKVAK